MSMYDKKKKKPGYKKNLQKVVNPSNVFRGEDGQCYEKVKAEGIGFATVPVVDPDGEAISWEEENGVALKKDFIKIPRSLWCAWVNLAFDMCGEKKKYSRYNYDDDYIFGPRGNYHGYPDYRSKKFAKPKPQTERKKIPPKRIPKLEKKKKYNSWSNYYGSSKDYEVQVVLLRSETDDSWKLVVPLQVVSGARVNADLTQSCDLITGEIYNQFPVPGYYHFGSSHSHNTMGVTFSGIDDDHELIIPGLHIVVGSMDKDEWTYDLNASFAIRGNRKFVHFNKVVEPEGLHDEEYTYHENCKKFVVEEEKVNPPKRNYNDRYSLGNTTCDPWDWESWADDETDEETWDAARKKLNNRLNNTNCEDDDTWDQEHDASFESWCDQGEMSREEWDDWKSKNLNNGDYEDFDLLTEDEWLERAFSNKREEKSEKLPPLFALEKAKEQLNKKLQKETEDEI